MDTAMGKLVLAFVLGMLWSHQSSAVRAGRSQRPPAITEDLRFAVEVCERANDRLLEDIRALNVIAYTLLGPLLAIAAFVDYHDRWNLIPLALAIAAGAATFSVLHTGLGVPAPDPGDDTFADDLQSDPRDAAANVLENLRQLGRFNADVFKRERMATIWAGRLALLAMIATIAVKGVESSTR
jgi:hypothetical protein